MSRPHWTQLSRRSTLRVVGLMSGTSADGIDAALVDAGPRGVRLRAFGAYPYPPAIRREVLALSGGGSSVERVCHMNAVLGELFAQAVIRLARQARVGLERIDLIGSHGQTICHLPAGRRAAGRRRVRSTLQIAEPSVIAERTGVPVVADFRPRDVAAGGQGAPLVPYADWVLFAHRRLSRVLCNIGGIANVTWLSAGGGLGDVLAFDTGPGNMVVDELIRRQTHGRRSFDRDGRRAADGAVNAGLLRELLGHPFLRRRPPKTTGREQFGAAFVDALCRRGRTLRLGGADLVATATAFTCQAVARACRGLPGRVDELILCGGGSRNVTMTAMLRRAVSPVPVRIMDELGLSADAKEAVSFALLAVETIRGRANNVPSATGAARPVVLGKIVPGR